MSRCVSIVYRRVSETKHLYRDSDTCHRDRSTVQRDIRFCHRDRLSPRPETNRNFTLAVLYSTCTVLSLPQPVLNAYQWGTPFNRAQGIHEPR